MVRALLPVGFKLGVPRLQRLNPGCQLLDDLKQLQDQLAHERRGLLPLGHLKRQSCWERKRGSHGAPSRIMPSALFCAVNVAVREKSWGNVQRKMRAIPFVGTSARSPLNSYADLGSAAVLQGCLAEGRAQLEEAIRESLRTGALQHQARWVAWLSEVCCLAGRGAEAWQYARQALERARQHKERANEAVALCQLGAVQAHADPPRCRAG
jgi:hypothetical protein